MTEPAPLVSILISTFNRSRLLRRAINSLLMQDFADFEIVVIDDCSTDDTSAVVAAIGDPRIRYVRNETNVGAKLGDRVHVQRFVYGLMRGKYFVYLCDDDYWLIPDLLRRQVEIFQSQSDVAFVMGNQLSYILTTPDSYFGREPGDTITFTLDNIGPYFDLKNRTCKTHHFSFFDKLFPKSFMRSEEYLSEFASEPTTKNRIVGATLYSRDHFIRAGAMRGEGSKWQAGYEFLMGPACVGNVGYLNDPCIVTEIRAANASFQRTQVEHYLDAVLSVEVAFDTPLKDPALRHKRKQLIRARNEAIRNLSRAFLINTVGIVRDGSLGLCSDENVARPVTLRHVVPALRRNRAYSGFGVLLLGALTELEMLTGGRLLRAWAMRRRALPALRSGALRLGRLALAVPRRLMSLSWRIARAAWRRLWHAVSAVR